MNLLRTICTVIGAWLLVSIALVLAAVAISAAWNRWLARRCTICRVRCETLEHCRFGKVCSKCHDAVFRLYHYRMPRLSDEQAKKIMKNLWRDVEGYDFGGDGWKNG